MRRIGSYWLVVSDESRLDLDDLLHPDEQQRFRRLCLETSEDELGQLTEVVELHLQQLDQTAGPVTDTETAQRIASSITSLLTSGDRFGPEERALIRGAVEYFLLADDAAGDLDDALGFDDDARVLNAMLDRIGRPQFRVELS